VEVVSPRSRTPCRTISEGQPILLITENVALRLLTVAGAERTTGFDFKDATLDRQKLYFEGIKDSKISFEPFATTLFRSVGRKSRAEPLKTIEALPLTLDWALLTGQVGIFFSTISLPSQRVKSMSAKSSASR
jgi:hypothetical protein